MPVALWKSMLAAKPDPDELDKILTTLRYPLLGSPKYDGIRCSVQNGKLYSRSLKLIPNKAMQKLWGRSELEGLDGEIVVGSPVDKNCFQKTSSVVMSADKPIDDAVLYGFDVFGRDRFEQRLVAASIIGQLNRLRIQPVAHVYIEHLKGLLKYETAQVSLGFEGIMLRDSDGLYKQGRSTMKEGGLIAVKRFVDAEAVILDTYEQEENTNEKTMNELGNSKRSTHKAGKVGKDTLGGFSVVMLDDFKHQCNANQWTQLRAITELAGGPLQFNIGTGVGLTEAYRQELWNKRKALVGKIIKFRYQKMGTLVAPRMPIFLGFRDKRDL